MRNTILTAAVCGLLAVPLAGDAASTKLEPGLWETTAKTQMMGTSFSPPAQTHRSCLTREQAEHPWRQLQASKSEDCEFTNVEVSGQSASWKMECDGQGGHMIGTGKATFTDPKHMNGVVHMLMHASGQDMKVNIETQGHWVGADCSN